MVEAGLGFLPFCEKAITTPTGAKYVGVEFARKLCGVSLIRSGESMETALRACCQGIKIGKILVHRCAAIQCNTHCIALNRGDMRGRSGCVGLGMLQFYDPALKLLHVIVTWAAGLWDKAAAGSMFCSSALPSLVLKDLL